MEEQFRFMQHLKLPPPLRMSFDALYFDHHQHREVAELGSLCFETISPFLRFAGRKRIATGCAQVMWCGFTLAR
jgi:hypothetical protein